MDHFWNALLFYADPTGYGVLAIWMEMVSFTIVVLLGGTLTVLGVWIGALLPSKEKPS